MISAPGGVAVTIMMILFSVTDFIGFKLVLGTFFGIEPFYAILIMAASVAFYVSVGGFRAVVWTDLLQYILLAGLAVYVAIPITGADRPEGRISVRGLHRPRARTGGISSSWAACMGALVFQLALLPGWVAEQDPWQKIWAARDERSAKRGLLLGAALLALVYLCCLLTAIGLSVLYPRPAGEVEAEMLYLKIISDNVSPGSAGAAYHRLCRSIHVLHRHLRHLGSILHLARPDPATPPAHGHHEGDAGGQQNTGDNHDRHLRGHCPAM